MIITWFNPNRQETDQLAIYLCGQGVDLRPNEYKIS